MTHVEFIAIGNRDGIPLFQHECPVFKVTYISEEPSPPDDPDGVPMCGCQPAPVMVEVLFAGS